MLLEFPELPPLDILQTLSVKDQLRVTILKHLPCCLVLSAKSIHHNVLQYGIQQACITVKERSGAGPFWVKEFPCWSFPARNLAGFSAHWIVYEWA